jgi:hypothetical protein
VALVFVFLCFNATPFLYLIKLLKYIYFKINKRTLTLYLVLLWGCVSTRRHWHARFGGGHDRVRLSWAACGQRWRNNKMAKIASVANIFQATHLENCNCETLFIFEIVLSKPNRSENNSRYWERHAKLFQPFW